jgi:hypothetical protein
MLQVVYIASEAQATKPKRLTAQQKLHMQAIAELVVDRAKDRIAAQRKFAAELLQLETLERQYGIIN